MFNILWNQKRCEILYYFSVHPECGKVLFWQQIKNFWPYFLSSLQNVCFNVWNFCFVQCFAIFYKVQIKSSIFLCPVITLCTKKFDLHCNSIHFFIVELIFLWVSFLLFTFYTRTTLAFVCASTHTLSTLSTAHYATHKNEFIHVCVVCLR